MSHTVPAPHTKSMSAARRVRRATLEAGVVLSLTLAIIAVACTFGIERAAASGLDTVVGSGDGRLTIGAALIALFAGMCVLTTFMLRNTLDTTPRTGEVRSRSRLG